MQAIYLVFHPGLFSYYPDYYITSISKLLCITMSFLNFFQCVRSVNYSLIYQEEENLLSLCDFASGRDN